MKITVIYRHSHYANNRKQKKVFFVNNDTRVVYLANFEDAEQIIIERDNNEIDSNL